MKLLALSACFLLFGTATVASGIGWAWVFGAARFLNGKGYR